MRRWLTPIAFLLIATVAMPLGAQAPSRATYLAASDSTRIVGEAYMQAYIAENWDAIEGMLSEKASFRDPTAEALWGGALASGREAMMQKFRTGYAGIELAFEQSRATFSGYYAIFEGTLTWSAPVQGGGRVEAKDSPFVVILRVEGGKVVEHRDYADYHPFIDAMKAREG